MIVIADTGPINYLILIGEIDVLAALYQHVLIPGSVCQELKRPRAPQLVRTWIAQPPDWLEVRAPARRGTEMLHLDTGERDAILLAEELRVYLIIDEIRGRREAARRCVPYTGTLGVLSAAVERGLLDLRNAVDRLRRTNFPVAEQILDSLLKGSS